MHVLFRCITHVLRELRPHTERFLKHQFRATLRCGCCCCCQRRPRLYLARAIYIIESSLNRFINRAHVPQVCVYVCVWRVRDAIKLITLHSIYVCVCVHSPQRRAKNAHKKAHERQQQQQDAAANSRCGAFSVNARVLQ